MSRRQGIIRGGAWSLAAKSITAICAIVANAIIARLLSAEVFGTYVIVASLTLVGSTVGCLGMNNGLIRLVSMNILQDRANRVRWLVRTVLLTCCVTSLVLGITGFGFFGSLLSYRVFNSPLLVTVSVPAIIWLFLRTVQQIVASSFRGLQDLRSASIFEGSLTAVLSVIGLIACQVYVDTPTIYHVIVVVVLATAISTLTGVTSLFTHLPEGKERSELSGIVKLGLPLLITSTALFSVAEFHVWLLSALRPEQDVALYGAAQRLVKLVAFPLVVVNSVIPPFIAKLYARNEKEQLETLLRSAATICALPSLTIVAILATLAPDVMNFVFGPFYAAGGTTLAVLVIGHGVNVMAGSPGVLLLMTGHQKFLMTSAVCSGLFGILVTYILAPQWGAAGAATGTATTLIAQNLAILIFARYKIHIRTEMSLALIPMIVRKFISRS
ncbi:MAG: oligosaccharide flippase family protein [Gammaproteobacteria bacterium]|nr:oligosaccharide flippase family protein [Gammaproteobacteria bacterium]NNL51574.1 oligosaccharide flippase family protein [Woeseiaceae bacterium]